MDFWNASPDYGFLNADSLLVTKPCMKPRSLDIIGTRKRKVDENGEDGHLQVECTATLRSAGRRV